MTVSREEMLEKVDQIDGLLSREENDRGYEAFVHMRKIWPKLAALARSQGGSVPAQGVSVPRQPTEAMLIAARDWSHEKYGKPIGNDAATGCWLAMHAAALLSSPHANNEWRPIEEAPKDSTEVWLGAGDDDPRRQRVAVGYWAGKRGWMRGDADDEQLVWKPTHWQPYSIPAPPSSLPREEQA